jgi:ABC-2 type transport system ATP-binding protein
MTAVLEADRLGKRYGRKAALTDCDLAIPAGRVVGLVGPNGAGKSTLLQLACGLVAPSAGVISVLGSKPAASAEHLAKVGFVAQDAPVYAGLTVADHLHMGARLNPGWDAALARRRIEQVGLNPQHRAGRLSGGQRAQLALTLAVAKRPELLIFDEPAAALDPLARYGFLAALRESVADLGASAILSSHTLADVEMVCDYLIVLADSRVQIAADAAELLASHYRLIGTRGEASNLSPGIEVIRADHGPQHSTLIVRTDGRSPVAAISSGTWTVENPDLQDLVLAYMTRAQADAQPVSRTQETHR